MTALKIILRLLISLFMVSVLYKFKSRFKRIPILKDIINYIDNKCCWLLIVYVSLTFIF